MPTRKRRIAPEDLTRFKLVSDARLSPDGSRILFTRKHVGEKNNYVTNLWTVPTEGGPPRAFTTGGKDRHGRFSPDGATIAFISDRDKPRSQLALIDADGGEARALTTLPEGKFGTFVWSPDGTHIAFSFREQDPEWTEEAIKERTDGGLTDPPRVIDHWWYRLDGDGWFNAQRFQLYVVNVATGEHRKMYDKDTLGFLSFDFSPDSKKLAVTTNRDRRAGLKAWNDEILIMDVKSGKAKPVPNLPDGPKDAVKWSPDGRFLAYGGRVGSDSTYSVENLDLWVCDPVKGNARCLTAKHDYCLLAVCIGDTADANFNVNIQWSRDAKRIFMQLGWHGQAHVASVAARGGKVTFHTSGVAQHDMGGLSELGEHMALTRYSATSLPDVYVAPITNGTFAPRKLTNINQDVFRELTVANITSHQVKTEDGTTVQTWIMMPPDHTKGSRKKYPAVLEVHGGPHGQYGVGYFHEFQCLAAAGYVVVFSNPRGSKGYGRDYCAAIKGAWGTADWVDIQAVTRFMQEHPNINAKRMGVMGGSYGGYMTNWVIGHTNDFAGAITDRCVSNVVTMGGTSDFVDIPDDYFPGNFWDRIDARWEQSPMKYAGNIKTPTLIIHSEGDLRCNIEQSEQLYSSLTLRKIPTRFVRYPRTTSHGMSRGGPPDMRLHRLHQILNWWKKYLR